MGLSTAVLDKVGQSARATVAADTPRARCLAAMAAQGKRKLALRWAEAEQLGLAEGYNPDTGRVTLRGGHGLEVYRNGDWLYVYATRECMERWTQ